MSASRRDERLALNETIFRTANERMTAWEERREGKHPELYHCECSHEDCRERVELAPTAYEAVRADARHFVVAPGHADPSVESVVDHQDGYDVVEKGPEVDHIVKPTDPRS